MQVCPVCHEPVPGALSDHGVAAHGVVRPPLVMVVAGVLAAAGAYLLVLALQALPDLFDLLGEGEFARPFAALFLMIFLVIGGYGAALGAIGLLVWRGDRAARLLAYVACAPIAVAGLFGDASEGAYWLVGLAAVGVIAVLAAVPDVRAWFTGPFAAQRAEPPSVVAARALLGWTAYLSATGALVYLIVVTVLSDEIPSFLLYAASATLLAVGFFRLPTGEPVVRILASAGAGLALLATVVSGDTSVSALAIAGPAVAAVVVLWAVEDASRHFGTEPIVNLSSVNLGQAEVGGWGAASSQGWAPPPPAGPAVPGPGQPPAPPTYGAPTSIDPFPDLPPPTGAPLAPGGPEDRGAPASPVGTPGGGGTAVDLPPPTAGPWSDLPPPDAVGGSHAGPTAEVLAALPPPTGVAVDPSLVVPRPTGAGSAADPPGAPRPDPAPVSPFGTPPTAPAHRSLLGYTHLTANRAALLLAAAGARATSTGAGSARLEVRGAVMTVLAGDRTRIVVEADDDERRRRVALVTERSIASEDPAFTLTDSHVSSPEPSPLPTAPPAGWYDDPYRIRGVRWWDGLGWTADTSER